MITFHDDVKGKKKAKQSSVKDVTLTWFDFYGLGGNRTLLAYECDDIYRLPRSLGLTQLSWWRASASLRSRSVWLVHRNINIWLVCLYIMWWKIQPNCWRLERSGWQRGRILTSLISRWQELPGGSMAGLTNTAEMFNLWFLLSLCYTSCTHKLALWNWKFINS